MLYNILFNAIFFQKLFSHLSSLQILLANEWYHKKHTTTNRTADTRKKKHILLGSFK